MQRLSVSQMCHKIEREETFNAIANNYSFSLKIDHYTPFVCGAIHNGHQFRKELWEKCLHTEYDRWYEEDPETKNMVYDLPIVIAGCDSRFEYDLNRPPEEAIFDTAWGKTLWKVPLTEVQKNKSLKKHLDFYTVVEALITKIENKYGCCVVYDMHSYNWKRWDREVPTWNLGTSNIDNVRFGEYIELWRSFLEQISLPYTIKNTAKINDTFFGNGYFLKFITNRFKNTLVLATEISKIYCDELEQIIYPEVVEAVRVQLKDYIEEHAKTFHLKFSK